MPMLTRLLCLLFAISLAPCALAQPLATGGLRCEYFVNPLGIDEPAPRLTWLLTSTRRAERQTAYQVLVASTPELLAKDTGDLWDSGRVASEATSNIPYAGRPLTSREACHWKVRAWDRDGSAGPWSEPARWEMGLLAPGDWTAAWLAAAPARLALVVERATYRTVDGAVERDVTALVTQLLADHPGGFAVTNAAMGGDPAYGVRKVLRIRYRRDASPLDVDVAENATAGFPEGPLPLLRRSFSLDRPVRSARLYATALGLYELRLNGARVGDHQLAPGWTDYPTRLHYQTYDVTRLLATGRNALAANVAPGWFSGRAGLFGAHHFYGPSPALLAQLEVTYTDGTTQRITTDGSWRAAPGPIRQADLLQGETYDAAAAIAGWDTSTFDDSGWATATTRTETRHLQSDPASPVRILAELPAKNVTQPGPGRWTFDLGQNMVGVARLKIAAPRGTRLTLRHAEILNPDGTIYADNLRGAACTDTYLCSGQGTETWQPAFTFHGFRYVELTGLPDRLTPSADAVTGVVLGSDLPETGTFECSDPRVNQLQSNIRWGLRGNYLSIPTDCPQRDERMGWMADAQVFTPTAAFNTDIAPFMTKWLADVRDAQRADGAHSDVAPAMKGLSYGTPAWGDAGSIVPWALYQTYGDTRILERSVDSMVRWVEWCRAHSNGLIRERDRGNDYGDWLAIGADTPKDLIGTAYFAHSTDLLARTLSVLGRERDADRYAALAREIAAAFRARYVEPDGRMKGNAHTQCAYILALRFGLLEDAQRERAAAYLVSDLQQRDWRLSTGFVGVSHLLPVLSSAGQDDAAGRLILQDAFPSWLFSVKHGATTIWERWDGWTPERGPHPDASMNSFNHYSLGSCGQWLFQSLAGIDQAPDSAGFARLSIHPRTNGFTSARARYQSIRGPIRSEWSRTDAEFTLRLSLPPNTSATVMLPGPARHLSESGIAIGDVGTVRVLATDARETRVEIGSGDYVFTSRTPPPPTKDHLE